MSDQEIITLDSDDEGDSAIADLIVGPTGTAVPMREARKHGLTARLPLPPGMPSRPPIPRAPTMMGRAMKIPKKPGAFPPFALFSQENRDKVLQENKELSFTDVGKRMGELWHTLTEEEKEDYRVRAREIADRKLKDWNDKMKAHPQMASQYNAQAANTQKRRRTHGYAIFSSEMRKKMVTDNLSAQDTTKLIAEQWRNASAAVRQTYVARANKINEVEARKNQQILLQTQRRQQMIQQNQRMQQQKQQQMMLQQQQMRNNFSRGQMRQTLQGSQGGLRISGISSLSNKAQQMQQSRSVNLPSSITISRVEPEIDTSNMPPGLSIQRMRGPPPLMRGGLLPQQQRGRMGLQQQRQLQQQQMQQQQQQIQLQLHQHLAMQQRQQQVRGGRQGMPGRGGGMPLQMAGLKRPMPGRPMGVLPPKQPRLAPAPQPLSQAAQMNDLLIGTRLCRLCGQAGPYNYLLKDKPEAVEAIGFVLGLELDLEHDKAEGYPETICRKCTTGLSTLSLFKKSVDSGQSKLKSISEERQKKREEASQNTSENSILPDLDCEVDFGENPDSLPQPSLGIKAESLEDELEKRQSKSVSKENGTKAASTNSEHIEGNGNGTNEDDDVIDPLMFIQVSHVESNFSDFEDDGGDLHDGDEAMEIEEHLQDAEEEDEKLGNDDSTTEKTSDHEEETKDENSQDGKGGESDVENNDDFEGSANEKEDDDDLQLTEEGDTQDGDGLNTEEGEAHGDGEDVHTEEGETQDGEGFHSDGEEVQDGEGFQSDGEEAQDEDGLEAEEGDGDGADAVEEDHDGIEGECQDGHEHEVGSHDGNDSLELEEEEIEYDGTDEEDEDEDDGEAVTVAPELEEGEPEHEEGSNRYNLHSALADSDSEHQDLEGAEN